MAAKPAVGRPGGLLAAPASRQRALVSRPRPRAPGRVAAAPEAAVASPLIIPFEPHAAPRAEAPPGAPPLVILPGFGNAARDYEAPFGDAEAGLAAALRRRGWAASALPLRRKDWLRVAAMLARPDYWRGGCDAFAGYKFYLDAVAAEVARVQAATGAERVVLVAHSAGGWLARAFIGDARCRLGVEGAAAARPGWAASLASLWDGLTDSDAEASASAAEDEAATGPHPAVAALVTLGAPHAPPPPGSGARDVTGGAQGWVRRKHPKNQPINQPPTHELPTPTQTKIAGQRALARRPLRRPRR
jgi:pimeloyl-ACP methyl ester carboxylesterase